MGNFCCISLRIFIGVSCDAEPALSEGEVFKFLFFIQQLRRPACVGPVFIDPCLHDRQGSHSIRSLILINFSR